MISHSIDISNLQKITCIILRNLFGLYLFSSVMCHRHTPSSKKIYPRKSSNVTARLNGASVAEAHHLAVSVAAFVCTQSGAVNPVPERLKTFMKY